jgi:hypothetical protein
VIVWLWDADGPARSGRGVTGNGEAARQAAEAFLRGGHASAARVERAVSMPGVRALTAGYQRTGDGWTAVHRDGRVTWIPFAVRLPGRSS